MYSILLIRVGDVQFSCQAVSVLAHGSATDKVTINKVVHFSPLSTPFFAFCSDWLAA